MVPRENKNNAYAKFGRTNKEYYGIFQTGLLPLATCKCRLIFIFDVLIILQSLFIVNFFQQTSPQDR